MAQLPDGLQPLHAVYGKKVVPVLERMALSHELKIRNIASDPSLRVTVVSPVEWGERDPHAQSFRNVNTPADLEAARAVLRKQAQTQ